MTGACCRNFTSEPRFALTLRNEKTKQKTARPLKDSMEISSDSVSQLLQRWSDGDSGALDQLTPLVYGELRRMARRALAERAYWGCLSNLLRGNFTLSSDLLRYAVARCPDTMILPPVGYLLRHGDSLERITKALSETGSRWRTLPGGSSPIS